MVLSDPIARVAYFEDSILRVVKSKGFKQFEFIKKFRKYINIKLYNHLKKLV